MPSLELVKDITTLVVSITSLVGTIVVIIKVFFPPKKDRAELAATWEDLASRSAKQINAFAKKLDEQDAEMTRLETKRAMLEARLRRWKRGIDLLIEQLESNNLIPVWRPEELHEEDETHAK